MADFLLVAGIDTGTSFANMQDDIKNVIEKLNLESHKIKIGLEIDNQAIESFRKSITNLQNTLGGSTQISIGNIETSSVDAFADGIAGVAQQAQSSSAAIQTMGASIDSINTDHIVSGLQEISGIDSKGAEALANSIKESNVNVSQVKAKLSEVTGEEQKLVSLQVQGTNQLGQAVTYLLKYNTENGKVDKTLLDIVMKYKTIKNNEEESTNETKKKVLTYEKLLGLQTSLIKLLQANTNAQGLDSYRELQTISSNLKTEIDAVANGTKTEEEALKSLGENGTIFVNDITNAMSKLKAEMASTGVSGKSTDISYKTINDKFTTASKLLTNNTNAKDLGSYKELDNIVSNLKAEINAVNSGFKTEEEVIKSFGKNGAMSIDDITNAMSKLKAEMASTGVSGNIGEKSLISQAEGLIQKINSNGSKWTAAKFGKSSENYNKYVSLAPELQQAVDSYKKREISVKELNNKLKDANNNARVLEGNMRFAGEATGTFSRHIKNLVAGFAQWFSATRIVMAIYRTIKQMISASIELNSAMAQLKIVTGASDTQMQQFLTKSISLAKELGQSVTSTMKSVETFSRLGYNLSESSELTKFSSMLSNVAAVDQEETTKGLTSIIKGYQMNVSEAEHVSDVLVDVGQKYAVSAGEMMEAYEKSGAALSATNTSFEKSAGLIAAANASVQNASTVGTALKTVSARIRGAKTELTELGEDTGELLGSFSKYEKEIRKLTGFSIVKEGTVDTYKDLYDIFDGISSKWKSLTETQQSRVAEILGGTRQYQVISSILGNFGDAAGAYETAMNSAGATTKANSIYMQTAQARIEQFKATFTDFSQSMVDSGLVSDIVEMGSGILNFVKQIATISKNIGGLKTVLLGVVAAIVLLKRHTIELKISSMLVRLKNIPALLTSMKTSIVSFGKSIADIGKNSGWTSTIGQGTGATTKALQSMIPVIGLAVTAATIGSAIIKGLENDAKERLDAKIKTAEESKSKLTELSSAWNDYVSLDKTATEEEQSAALSAVTDKLSDKAEALDNAKKSQDEYNNSVQQAIKDQYAKAAADSHAAAVDAGSYLPQSWGAPFGEGNWRVRSYKRQASQSELFGNDIELSQQDQMDEYAAKRFEEIMGEYYRFSGWENAESASYDLSSDVSNEIKQNPDKAVEIFMAAETLIEEFKKLSVENSEKYDYLLKSKVFKSLSKLVTPTAEGNSIPDYINKYTQNTADEMYNRYIGQNGLPKTIEEYNKFADVVKESNRPLKIQEMVLSRLKSELPALAKETENLASKTESTGFNFNITDDKLKQDIKTATEGFSDITTKYKNMSDVITNYNIKGYLTVDDFANTAEAGSKYIQTLFNEEGQLELNKEAYIKLAKAKIEDIRYSYLEKAISDMNALSKEGEAKATDDLAISEHTWTEVTLKRIAAQKRAEGVSINAIENIMQEYMQIDILANQTLDSLEKNTDATFGYTNATKASTEALQTQKKALEDKKKALEEEQTALNDGVSAIKARMDLVVEMLTKEKKLEKEALEKKKKDLKEIIDERKEALSLAEKEYKWQKEISEKQNSVASNAVAEAIASLDDSAAGKKSKKEASDNLKESRIEVNQSLIEHEYDTRKESLDKLKDDEEKRIDDQIEAINKYLDEETQIQRDACKLIDNDRETLYNKLKKYVFIYTNTTQSEFERMWAKAEEANNKYNKSGNSTLSLLDIMQGRLYYLEDQIQDYTIQIDHVSTSINKISESVDDNTTSINNNSKAIENYKKKIKEIEEYLNKDGWKYEHATGVYYSLTPNKEVAAQDIASQISKNEKVKHYVPPQALYAHMEKLAVGSKSAKGGLTTVDEEGLYSELIPRQVGNGRYTILPEGNPVFSKAMTNKLFDFASNPKSFISGLLPPTNNAITSVTQSSVVSPSISINVQGDATQSTISALKNEANNIIKRATDNIMNIALRNKKFI